MDSRPTTNVELKWGGGRRFKSYDCYGNTVTIDAPERDGEKFDGFMPGEMLLTSLAGCSGIDVADILRRQRQDMTGIDIKVLGTQQSEAPWIWESVHLDYTVRGRGLDAGKVERAIHLSETKYCSVGATIGGRCEITSAFEIVNEGA